MVNLKKLFICFIYLFFYEFDYELALGVDTK